MNSPCTWKLYKHTAHLQKIYHINISITGFRMFLESFASFFLVVNGTFNTQKTAPAFTVYFHRKPSRTLTVTLHGDFYCTSRLICNLILTLSIGFVISRNNWPFRYINFFNGQLSWIIDDFVILELVSDLMKWWGLYYEINAIWSVLHMY